TQSTADTNREFLLRDGSTRMVECKKRPWGNMEIFSENTISTVKLLTINAGQCLSKQRHYCRDELFIALDDNVGFQIEEKRVVLEKGDYIIIPRGVTHRVSAYKNSARVLEVIYGFYDQIHDLERLEDKYGRVDSNGTV
ncbi:MAG: cupin domain-containing protein, partial [Candidatus Zixiibacteriota bacterium]